jgi:spiro-SPASM protein
VDQLSELSPEAVVSISHWGELGLHPQVMDLVRDVAGRPHLRLLVETSGVGWSPEDRDELFGTENVTVIVGLDTNDPETYRKVRGEGFSEAVGFAERAVDRLGDRAHVQAVRCDLTDPVLNDFYQWWSAKTDNVIIQKYDWFSAVLPHRKIGDLAPLKRFPCWHLQRDMTILVDGSVPLCREDLEQKHRLGNVFEDSLESVWAAGKPEYDTHIQGSYPGVCERCDEYYTFNF